MHPYIHASSWHGDKKHGQTPRCIMMEENNDRGKSANMISRFIQATTTLGYHNTTTAAAATTE